MPITLTELVREFAQSAVAMDDVCAKASHANFLEDCDATPDPEASGLLRVPQTERVKISDDQKIDVPTATLHDQAGLQAKRLKLAVSSDVDLEGRQIETAGHAAETVYDIADQFTFNPGSSGVQHGVETKLNQKYGTVDDSTLEMKGRTYTIAAIFYQGVKAQCVLRVMEIMRPQDWAGALLKLESTVPGTAGGEHVTTLHFDQANWDNGETTGAVHWVEQQQLAWMIEVAEAGGTVTVTIMQPVKVKEDIEAGLHPRHNYRSEVLVSFREGLSANHAKLTLEVEFERHECSEGVALMRDRMNQDLSHQLR